MTEPSDLVSAAAQNLAVWHEASVAALGHRSEWAAGGWLTVDPVPAIYFGWIGTQPGSDPVAIARVIARRTRRGRPASACDPWRTLDLAPQGFEPTEPQAWWARVAQPLPVGPHPRGVSVEVVRSEIELARYEGISAEGFGVPAEPPFRWHGPPLLLDRRLTIFLGRLDGRPAAAAMAFVEAGVVGVYGVATVPSARGRGLATALTGHAIAVAPRLPAVLQPSREAERLYERLGFAPFGDFATWARPG
jgi:GNAT superfamily N-acetyltransferase